MILDRIIESKRTEVAQLKKTATLSELRAAAARLAPCRDFRAAVSGRACAIIAEVKCASPSRGRLVLDFEPLKIAQTYEQNGAAAISVLTDEQYFCGSKVYLSRIKEQVSVPVLRKDFIIDPLQVYETRHIGADAILLIVRILGPRLEEFLAIAGDLGLCPLVEVHTEAELDTALAAGADIIGINNRNLDTFVTDIDTSRILKRKIPGDKTAVAESAIAGRADIEYLMRAGIHAFLIGESLVTAADIGKELLTFLGENGG